MNGLHGSILDTKYKIGINGGFGFRPAANRVLLKESETLTFQYWERRYYFYTGIDKKFDLIRDYYNSTGPFLGINEIITFGGYRGSDENPAIKLITVPLTGWYYSNRNFTTWAGYQHLNYNTPEIKPGRITIGINVNIGLTKKRLKNKKIDWLE
jgi:hypothetical protein